MGLAPGAAPPPAVALGHARGVPTTLGEAASTPTSRSVLRGLAVLRWGTWVWSLGVVVVGVERVARPGLAGLLMAACLVVTVAGTAFARRPGGVLRPGFVLTELAVGFALLALEGFVFEPGHAFAGRQGLAGGWPVVGVIGAGFTLGPGPAAAAGAVVGVGRLFGALGNGVRAFDGDEVASLAATVAFYALYGGVAGWVGNLLRAAEQEVAVNRARQEVARTLHDGVLQTLALVERRTATSDPLLARLARDTDRDLRSFLDAPARRPARRSPPDLVASVREAARRSARPYDLDVVVSVVEEGLRADEAQVEAVAGAVAEAVANAGKHAAARRVVVFLEVGEDGVLFVSVRDDGTGFDAAAVPAGRGLQASVHGRVAEVGGRAEVVSTPGEGTEVRLWL